jgi:acyl dehydratase
MQGRLGRGFLRFRPLHPLKQTKAGGANLGLVALTLLLVPRSGHWNGAEQFIFSVPVPVDSRVRGKAEVVSVDEVGGGWWQVVTRFTLEVEGSEKPCFVGDSVTRVMAPAG